MKNSTLLTILLALGLVFTSYKWITSTPSADTTYEQKSTINDILTRTSVRSYTSEPISQDQIDTLLRSAMAAPTAGNKQPWRFVVINRRDLLDSISHNFQSMTMAAQAPLAIIMCGDTTATLPGQAQEYWVQDLSAASENLLLAAHAMKLGAVWCGIYPITQRTEQFSAMLHLPTHIIPMACICIGHPQSQNTPKDKWVPENIHYNTWQ